MEPQQPTVSLQLHFETLLAAHAELDVVRHHAEERERDLVRRDLDNWKAMHNQWAEQMRQAQLLYVTRIDHSELTLKIEKSEDNTGKRIAAVERLVYIGVGAVLVLNIVLTFLKH
jgi:hypothetical protein